MLHCIVSQLAELQILIFPNTSHDPSRIWPGLVLGTWKGLSRYQIQVQERVEQTPITLRQERAVPVEKIETLQVNRQVPKPMAPRLLWEVRRRWWDSSGGWGFGRCGTVRFILGYLATSGGLDVQQTVSRYAINNHVKSFVVGSSSKSQRLRQKRCNVRRPQ